MPGSLTGSSICLVPSERLATLRIGLNGPEVAANGSARRNLQAKSGGLPGTGRRREGHVYERAIFGARETVVRAVGTSRETRTRTERTRARVILRGLVFVRPQAPFGKNLSLVRSSIIPAGG